MLIAEYRLFASWSLRAVEIDTAMVEAARFRIVRALGSSVAFKLAELYRVVAVFKAALAEFSFPWAVVTFAWSRAIC